MTTPVEKRVQVNQVELVYFEWGDPADTTTLFVHATGFHARCWDQVINCLDDTHIIAVDMRGHGRSEKRGPFTWKVFGDDVTALVSQLDLHNIIGVGHSMGGHSVTQAAANQPQRFNQLLLVDPVIMAPEIYQNHAAMAALATEEHPVARRRNHFADSKAMYDNFHGRGSYASWTQEALQDYCQYGLEPASDGEGFQLACPPDIEASIYQGNFGCDVHHLLPTIDIPVTVLRAQERTEAAGNRMDFSLSPTWPGVASKFPQGRDIYLPELTHFIPMQQPERVAEYLKESQ